ncbi:MAG: uncharacterized protein PWP15_986 [Methanothermococcus sp.]|jgi:hypothetical protein|uniref:endonuclease dU n=1 Tax=Methanothermococcus TaxID=155862 RepID=UPI00036D2C6A|nr:MULTISPECIES: DUF99 family protein [Methanothermococcus]MDK2790479.1 uncharacterized protein [Methanothermococcus sp.]MDK2987619.1 uncharacterized protein [Methanothermococcus sp.]
MKDEIGVIGIDDASFKKEDDEVILIGTYFRGNKIIDGIYFKKIQRDGNDVTEKIIQIVKGKHYTKINAIFLDGVTFGGFNIADIFKINEETKKPVIVVVEKKPDRSKMIGALEKYFKDLPNKINLLKSFPEPEKIEDVYVQYIGIEKDEVRKLIQKTRLKSKVPECLRISHLIGRGFLNIS